MSSKYSINYEKLKQSFSKGQIDKDENGIYDLTGKFQHCKGRLIKAFPFATDAAGLNDSTIDLYTFNGTVGNLIRTAENLPQKTKVKLDKESILSSIKERDDFQGIESLDILLDNIEKLLFEENGDIFKFDYKVLRYLNFLKENAKLKDISNYTVGVLLGNDEELKKIIAKTDTPANENLLYRLVLETIKEESEKEKSKKTDSKLEGYYEGKLTQNLRKLFAQDISILSEDENYFIDNIHNLLKFYFFQFVSQLAIQLNQFFYDEDEDTVPKLFFTLKWEKISKSRLGIINGWKLLDKNVETLFAHANTLEFLNTIEWSSDNNKIYSDIKSEIDSLDDFERSKLSTSIDEIIDKYKNNYVDEEKLSRKWEEVDLTPDTENDIYNRIITLYKYILFQFQNSPRNSAFKAYKGWFTEFCKVNYSKRRGQLGFSLSIDKSLLLLLTDLAVGSNNKILLKELWDEFELRGLRFDQESKAEIIKLYEEINLIEKKSDSGDAQYIQKLNK
ncbi:DNA phosphorothioation-dependent restriction protein DptG [Flammeovirga agarivorans]|uniref:DNA phosphorothioation-dependent restriction protein DptG n=1 Tax=Flammeovirga agarivorans TaxID=2726742 RepID=A0A7X8SKP6_9BACT|nr:DNA phosphorothioation-dependent restriction protein DptG [Flammeovirga agarivorans]NLR91917.1 DNA phosphorothioation-dependent restriction protein DptG [Flammeovirga agarivorans]